MTDIFGVYSAALTAKCQCQSHSLSFLVTPSPFSFVSFASGTSVKWKLQYTYCDSRSEWFEWAD